MPGFDGTGPRGFGPGRGLGPCGRGRNRFWNYFNPFNGQSYNQFDTVDQKSFLEKKLQLLEEEKRKLTEKIEELKRN